MSVSLMIDYLVYMLTQNALVLVYRSHKSTTPACSND